MSDSDQNAQQGQDAQSPTANDPSYAKDLGPVAGRDEQQPGLAGSDESGYAAPVAPEVKAGAPSNYVEIDEGA